MPELRYVTCRETISSPAPSPGAVAIGFTPNMVCGERCDVVTVADEMFFRCPLGHCFIATPADIQTDDFEIVSETHTWDAPFAVGAFESLADIQAHQRERIAEHIARENLPQRLRWLVDRPRLLRLVYALRPAWRPTIYVGTDGEFTVYSARSRNGRIAFFEGSTARVSDPIGPTNGPTEPKTPISSTRGER